MACLRRQSMPPVTKINDATPLYSIRAAHDTCVIAFLDSNDGDSLQGFQTIAEDMFHSYVFGTTTNKILADTEEVSIPGIVVYKSVAEQKTTSEGPWSGQHGIEDFVRSAVRPLVAKLFPETHHQYLEATLPIGYIFTANPAQESSVAEAVLPLARKYQGSIQFMTVDNATLLPDLPEIMHLPDAGDGEQPWPAFALLDPLPNRKYPLGPVHSDEHVATTTAREELGGLWRIDHHVASFLDGRLEPVIKSKPIPKPDGSSAIIEVVGLTYDAVVLDSTRDILVEFCTKGCLFCEIAQPQYEALARLYAAHPDGPAVGDKVVIAKIDKDENGIPDRDLYGTPWFKLTPAARKGEPATYIGELRWDALADFIKENGTHGVGLDFPGRD